MTQNNGLNTNDHITPDKENQPSQTEGHIDVTKNELEDMLRHPLVWKIGNYTVSRFPSVSKRGEGARVSIITSEIFKKENGSIIDYKTMEDKDIEQVCDYLASFWFPIDKYERLDRWAIVKFYLPEDMTIVEIESERPVEPKQLTVNWYGKNARKNATDTALLWIEKMLNEIRDEGNLRTLKGMEMGWSAEKYRLFCKAFDTAFTIVFQDRLLHEEKNLP